MMDETHDPERTSWVRSANGHADFPIQNLPLGVFSQGDAPRGGMAIGDRIVDLAALARSGLLYGSAQEAAEAGSKASLNDVLALDANARRALRRDVSALLSNRARQVRVEPLLYVAGDCTMHLPATIGDYTDFYVGIHHATNIGRLFRPENPLLPNYKHVPIGYHGRASSVRVSGTPLVRPLGQLKPADADQPILAPTKRLDYELEMGGWVGGVNALGSPVPIDQAPRRIAGMCLLNDWSARDIQAWEYQPLGPFLSKNFLTTVSPWIVTSEALAPFRIAQPSRANSDPAPLPYLHDPSDQASGAFAITLEVSIQSARMRDAGIVPVRLSRGPASNMYWTIAQMLTHHAINGCDLNPGDLLGTGTISASDRDGCGSLMEISRGGTEAVVLPTGERRTFLEDGDALMLSGRAEADGYVPIGFGPCAGIVSPAHTA